MAGTKDLTNEKRQKELIKNLIIDRTPTAIARAIEYMEENFNVDDPIRRGEAHKLFFKFFDKVIPNKQIIEHEDNSGKILDERINRAMEIVAQTELKKLCIQEAEIVSDEDAIKIRDSLRGK